MTATIIRIGNSNGVVIPSKIMKSLDLSERDTLVMKECEGGVFLKKVPENTPETPFSALDKWNDINGYSEEQTVEEILDYVDSIRGSRINKEISEW